MRGVPDRHYPRQSARDRQPLAAVVGLVDPGPALREARRAGRREVHRVRSALADPPGPAPSSTPISVPALPSGRIQDLWTASMTTGWPRAMPGGQRKIAIWTR